jgi:hypothetical protein
MSVRHVKYGTFIIQIESGNRDYSIYSHCQTMLNTFKITALDSVTVNNMKLFKDTEQYDMTIYQSSKNGVVLNPEMEQIKNNSKNTIACNTALVQLAFTSFTVGEGDLVLIRFTPEWKNFKNTKGNFKEILVVVQDIT